MLYKIHGYDVDFPHQAYGVQLVYMNHVLKALDTEGNALLSSPTGTGKTLSLLCSALAWQQRAKSLAIQRQHDALVGRAQRGADEKPSGSKGDVVCKGETSTIKAHKKESNVDEGPQPQHQAEDEDEDEGDLRMPRVYYATRTHSQIAQVVQELKRTAYNPRMAILASRQHYCINKKVKSSGRIDEQCEELMKEQGACRFFQGVRRMQPGTMVQVHDIEELAALGAKHKACPYFLARQMAQSADLVFAPYSYLLDPVVRAAMSVELKGCVLIFDEAHNIEDVARDAGSTEVDLETLLAVHVALATAAKLSSLQEHYEPLGAACEALVAWLGAMANGPALRQQSFERFEAVWAGQQLLQQLAQAGLGPEAVEQLFCHYEAVRKAEGGDKVSFTAEGEAGLEKVPEDVKSPGAGGLALGVMSRLLSVLRLLYRERGRRVGDYRLAVQKWVQRQRAQPGGRNFRSRAAPRDDAPDGPQWVVQLCLWSLNPAVVFEDVAGSARSIVLTSGTLSPMESFASELGVPFHQRLEAPHVVDMSRQVWAGVVPCGPSGSLLNATFKHADTLDFQDSVGQSVLHCCRAIPDGVLLFLPSYGMLEKLAARWKVTGLWAQLHSLKPIVEEPRQAGAKFDEAISEYYDHVRYGRGGLFIAVCRGKASEGIDFANGNARGVLVVGIPFPNVKDTKVALKKAYNSGAPRALQLLDGNMWYTQQAFRALNQAIGRCIRHRNDFGAIVLLDERFRAPRNQAWLSKWVRSAVRVYSSFPDSIAALQQFFQQVMANPPGSTATVAEAAAADAAEPAAAPAQEHLAGLGGKQELGKGSRQGQEEDEQQQQQQRQQRQQRQRLLQKQEEQVELDCGGKAGAMKAGTLHQAWSKAGAGESRMPALVATKAVPQPARQQQDQQQAGSPPWQSKRRKLEVVYEQEQQKHEQLHQQPAVTATPGLQQHDSSPARQQRQHSANQPLQAGQAAGQAAHAKAGYEAGPAAPTPPNLQEGKQQQQQQQQQQAGSAAYMQHWQQSGCGQHQHQQHQHQHQQAPMVSLSWVRADVADFCSFLAQQQQWPSPGQLQEVARIGVLECLMVAQELLQQEGHLHSLSEQWQCRLPRGLQALLAAHQPPQQPGTAVAWPQPLAALAGLSLDRGLVLITQAYWQALQGMAPAPAAQQAAGRDGSSTAGQQPAANQQQQHIQQQHPHPQQPQGTDPLNHLHQHQHQHQHDEPRSHPHHHPSHQHQHHQCQHEQHQQSAGARAHQAPAAALRSAPATAPLAPLSPNCGPKRTYKSATAQAVASKRGADSGYCGTGSAAGRRGGRQPALAAARQQGTAAQENSSKAALPLRVSKLAANGGGNDSDDFM